MAATERVHGKGAAPGKDSGSVGLLEETSLHEERDSAEVNKEKDIIGPQRRYVGSDKYRKPLSTMMQFEDDYCKKLPRNRRKKHLYLGLSCHSWLFLVLAFLQAVLVVGLQVAIAVLGNFRSGRLEKYVGCFEDSIGYGNGTLPSNITFPTFGRDKEIYVYFFISLAVYNFCLCIYALKVQNIVEVYMFLIINVLAIGYTGVQIYQFRGFGDACDTITIVGYLALANALMLIVFTGIFAVMSLFIYVEFGWKIYTRVGCNSDLRSYYRVYEMFMSGVKLLILFLLIFFVGQCVLLLFVDENNINYEFWVVVFVLIPTTFASYPLTYWIVRHENILGSIGLFITDILVIAYTLYKIARYVTRSCPICKEQVEDIEREVQIIEDQLNSNGSSSAREIIDRIEQFEHLVLLGVINLVIAVAVLFVLMYLLKQYGKGLKEYFAEDSQRSGGRVCSCCGTTRESFDVTPEPRKHTILNLTHHWKENKQRKGRNKSSSSKRDSDMDETLGQSAPNFNEAESTTEHNDFTTLKIVAITDESERINSGFSALSSRERYTHT